MRILFVRTYCPYSIFYGSEMRGSRFVEFLKSKGELDLLTLTSPMEKTDMEYVRREFSRFYCFDQHSKPTRLTALDKLRHLLPWQLTEHYSPDFQARIAGILEENQYDLIFVFKLEPVFYFLTLPEKWRRRVVIDFDDILSELYKNHYRDKPLTALKNSYSLKLYERKAMKEFRRVFVCSGDALYRVPERSRGKVGVVPNIFQSKPEDFFPAAADAERLLFVGSLDYFPNIEGLKWFFDAVWPRVKKAHPQLKLAVVGKAFKSADTLRREFNGPPDVEIAVNVPSVQPYYRDCFASVVPLVNGSGTRLKILESAAYGRPVLTTPQGMEGLDFADGRSLCVFKDADTFLRGYELLRDKDRYSGVAREAEQVLKSRYSSDAFLSAMRENWERITED